MNGGYSLVAAHGLLIVVASLVTEHRFQGAEACEIFLHQGSNLCPLHWQADSQPLDYQGSPSLKLLILSSIVLCKLPPNHPKCVSGISHDPQVPGFLGLCQGINTAVCLPIQTLSFTLLHVLPTLIQCPQTPSSYKLSGSS